MRIGRLLLDIAAGMAGALALAGLAALPLYLASWPVSGPEEAVAVFASGQQRKVTLAAVGDVMLSRKVGRLMNEHGMNYPVEAMSERLAGVDITFCNLESPIGTGGKPLPRKYIWFRAEPSAVTALVKAGFDVASVANNHALDYDGEVFLQTLDILKENGIAPVGGGADIAAARKPVIVEKNGLRLGFLAYSEMADIIWSFAYPRMLMATTQQSGIAPAGPDYLEAMLEDVELLSHQVDVVIVSLHWGQEYNYRPLEQQRQMGYALIEAGADLIIGHHPHTLQGLERYKNGLIAYSLGNFIFDQNFSQQTSEGLLLEVNLSALGVESASVSPVLIPQSQPQLATGEEGERIRKLTADLSAELGLEFGQPEGMPVLLLGEEKSKI